MKHKRLLGYGALGLTLIALGVAFVKPISTSNLLIRARADMGNLSVTFSRATGSQVVRSTNYYYTSGTTSLGTSFYLRNASNVSLGNNYVAVMCGTFDKGSVEPELNFTTTNSGTTGTSLFEFRNIKSISAVSNSGSSRSLAVLKSSDGTSWTSAGTLDVTSSGGTNTDVSGAKYVKLTYSGSYTVYLTSFTINYSCSDDPEEKELSSISVSGKTTEFTVGDSFSFGGTVTAHYDDSSSADVTSSATFTGYNMSQAGEQTVTVSYTENETTKTTSYSITVSSGSQSLTGTYTSSYTSFGETYTISIDFDNRRYSLSGSGISPSSNYCLFTYVFNGLSITFTKGQMSGLDSSARRLFSSSSTTNTATYNSLSDQFTVTLYYTSLGSEKSASYTFSK